MIGIFGGSGFYELSSDLREKVVETPYGAPSANPLVGQINGTDVAFLPRHGRSHEFPAHRVNYRANLWAFSQLGVTHVIGPCAAGSLQAEVRPGSVVVCDQVVDRTSGRVHTFYDGPDTVHVSWADPYCPTLRPLAVSAASAAGFETRDRGTVVVVEGPRFSTRAESAWFRSAGWEVINMTQYPEAYLARELQMCYVNLSLITDYDCGVEDDPSVEPVTMDEVMRAFSEALPKLKTAVVNLVSEIDTSADCGCRHALAGTPADRG